MREAVAQENLRYEITKIDGVYSPPDLYMNNGGEIVRQGPLILYKNGLKTPLPGGDYWVWGINNDRGDILASGGTKSVVYRLGERIYLDFEGYDINNGINLYHFGLGEPYGNVVGEHYLYAVGSGRKWNLEEMLHAQNFYAFLINDREQIAGRADIINTGAGQLVNCLVRYAPFGVFPHPSTPELIELEKDPNYPNHYNYMLHGINNKGQIVGGFYTGGLLITEYACMWDENGKLERLDAYPYPYNVAYAINDNEQIVGRNHEREMYAYQKESYAILWQNGKAINLDEILPENSPFIHLKSACDINNKGQIVGIGTTIEEETAIFLMNPIPKPSADLTEDGIVNFYDLAEFANRWLTTEP